MWEAYSCSGHPAWLGLGPVSIHNRALLTLSYLEFVPRNPCHPICNPKAYISAWLQGHAWMHGLFYYQFKGPCMWSSSMVADLNSLYGLICGRGYTIQAYRVKERMITHSNYANLRWNMWSQRIQLADARLVHVSRVTLRTIQTLNPTCTGQYMLTELSGESFTTLADSMWSQT